MPRRTLFDENSDIKRKANSTSSAVVLRPLKKKKILLGSSQNPAQERVFAREIKNFVGSTRQNAKAPDLGIGLEEPSLLNQLAADFAVLDLRGTEATREISTVPENEGFVTEDGIPRPYTLLPRQRLSSRSATTCAICNGRTPETPGYDSDNGSQIYSSAISRLCRRHRCLANAFNNTKHSSFRSASIASHSTPLPVQTALRPIHLFHPADDESRAHFQFPVHPGSKDGSKEQSQNETHGGADEQAGSHATDGCNDSDIMTQLASQLSEVVLSPCLAPVADELMDAPELDVSGLSQDSLIPLSARLTGRASSFSLGYIPVAFPGIIDIKDLRFTL